jgi:hypothetical protein
VDGLYVVTEGEMLVEKIAGNHVDQMKEIYTAVGHMFIAQQVKMLVFGMQILINTAYNAFSGTCAVTHIVTVWNALFQISTAGAFAEISNTICQLERKLLRHSLLLMANELEGMHELEGVPQLGVSYHKAGAAVHILSCIPVNVTILELPYCTQVIAWKKHLNASRSP